MQLKLGEDGRTPMDIDVQKGHTAMAPVFKEDDLDLLSSITTPPVLVNPIPLPKYPHKTTNTGHWDMYSCTVSSLIHFSRAHGSRQ